MIREHLWTILSILNYAVVLVAMERIIRRGREARGMLAWILTLILLPFLGLVLYLLIGDPPIERRAKQRQRRREKIRTALEEQTEFLDRSHDARESETLDEGQRALARLATSIGDSLVTTGNEVTISSDAEKTFLMLRFALESAQSHIHMEYYIFADDETGRGMRDLLVQRARAGIEVRLLLDAVGCWKLGRNFIRSLTDAGVEVRFFLPWGVSRRRFHINCRNHRKIVVIDGRIGFLGSQNVGDEYLGRRRRKFGPWRDTHLRVRGPAVTQLQEVFVEDWHFATGVDLATDAYFPEPEAVGQEAVQMVASGPDRNPDVLHQLLYAAVADAQDTISFMTPYFVPDRVMMTALKSAAYRGVRVRLMVPAKSDQWFVVWAARSFYEDLLEAGIEVYEFQDGMLHSKVVAIDRRWSMVGSANMDERSFRINFEITSILYGGQLAQQQQDEFDELLMRSLRITQDRLRAWTYGETMAAGIARLATPLL